MWCPIERREKMRIVNLSSKDCEMRERNHVETYFEVTLPKKYDGQFLCTERRVAQSGGMADGELLVFTYKGEVVYLALSASIPKRIHDTDAPSRGHPCINRYYNLFYVDTQSIRRGKGKIKDLEDALKSKGLHNGSLICSGWPKVDETGNRRRVLESVLNSFCA